jgi:hypothetical protein
MICQVMTSGKLGGDLCVFGCHSLQGYAWHAYIYQVLLQALGNSVNEQKRQKSQLR